MRGLTNKLGCMFAYLSLWNKARRTENPMTKHSRDCGPYLRLWTRDLFGDEAWMMLPYETRCAWLVARLAAFHFGRPDLSIEQALMASGASKEEAERLGKEIKAVREDPLSDAKVWIREWEGFRASRARAANIRWDARASQEQRTSVASALPATATASSTATAYSSPSGSKDPSGESRARGARRSSPGKKVWEGEIPENLRTPDFEDAWKLWLAYRREDLRKPVTQRSGDMALRELGGWGARRAAAAIRHTIARGWQGIRESEPEPYRNGKGRVDSGSQGEDWAVMRRKLGMTGGQP